MAQRLRLIPYPKEAEISEGTLKCGSVALCGQECVNGLRIDEFLEKYGVKVSKDGVKTEYRITDDLTTGKEGYRLSVTPDGISISAATDAGILYAFVTLIQLVKAYGGELPLCRIYDKPETDYRGFMLDSGRYFFSVDDVKKLIDLCVLHKINAFHWHLTEDQGWRVQIDKYPLLTEKGSKRSHTNFDRKPHGGFYTKQDIKEIVGYCKAHNITVMPEFDIPGHSVAALACYPWLGCFDRKLEVATHSGVKHDILCAGKESTYRFVFDVIDELAEMFSDNSAFIHIGGDEAVKTRWQICPHCQQKMKELGLKSENALQAYFMQRVSEYVAGKGFTPVIWNETDLSLPCHDKTVWQLWSTGNGQAETEDIAKTAAKYGGLINSDSAYTYLDLPYADISLEKSYSFKPIPDGITRDKFIGAEAALWSEYVPDIVTAYRRVLPRFCALSDVFWGRYGGDFKEFSERLKYFKAFLEEQGYKGASDAEASPSAARAFFQKLWFERRQLHWQGLRNLIDNASVKSKYGKRGK